MPAPILKFKRGNLVDLPNLQAGEPGFTVDKFDLFVGVNSTSNGNKIVGSARYWTRETTTAGSGVNLVEGTNNGTNAITIKSPASLADNQTYIFPGAPTSGGFLRSDGSGNLTWDTGSGFNGGSFPLSALDIDGGTDIGAAIVDADEFIVDDGGGGTNRKVDASRIKDYVLGGGQGANFSAINVSGITTATFLKSTTAVIGAGLTVTGALDVDSTSNFANTVTIASGGANVTGTVSATQFTGSGAGLTGGTTPISTLDIDGGTDIGADLTDGDLLVVDDGAGGTNRKTAMSRVKNYVLGGGQGATFAAVNVTGIATLGFVDSTQLKVSGVSTFTGTVDINGAIDADGGANIAGGETTLSSATVSDLTDNRVVIAGTGGALEDSGNLTFNGSQLGITGTVNASSTVTASAFHTGAEGSAIRVTSDTISGPATITLDPAGVGDNTGKVVIAGDFQVDGTTTTVNSTTMTVDDKNLELGTGAANDAAANGGGITIVSGEGNKTFNFEATGDNLGSSENLNIASGKVYKVNNVETLSATTLGANVVNSSLTNVGTLSGLAVGGTASVTGQITAGDLRNSDDGLIPLVGVQTASGHTGLVTAFKFRGSGLDNFIVSNGVADVVLTGVAATTYTSRQTHTATQGQTTFTVSAGYSEGFIDVYQNGVRLINGTDYAAENGSTFVMTDAATVGDEFESVAWKTLGNVATLQNLNVVDNLTVTGVTTSGTFFGNLTGTVNTASQPNITAVGTLSSLVASTAKVSDLTNDRVLIAGTDGELEDSGNLTFDGSTLGVTGTVNATSFTGSGAGLSAGTTPVTTLDIDGATDIGAAIVDADEFIIDDGGNGTNRKTDASRIKDYVLGGGQGANFSAINVSGITTATFLKATTATVGAGLTVTGALDVDGGANIASGLTVTGGATVGGAADFNGGVTANTLVVEDLTDNRVVIAGSGGELEDSGNLTFDGTTLAVTGAATVDNVQINGNEIDTSSGNLTLDSAGGTTTVDDNLIVSGNLTVNGTQTIINSTTVSIDDKNFQVATGAADDAAANGAGFTVNSGDGDKTWNFEATGDNWGSSENINLASGKVLKVNNSEVLSGTALSTNVVVDVASVNIDGATDIGGAIADADLFLVDDGAGGTNRKTAASRIKDYVLGGGQGANFSAINVSGITTATFLKATTATVGAGLTVTGALDVDGGANIASGLTVTGNATINSLKVSDLTNDRVLIAGTSGEIEDSGNLTFNGSTLGVTGGVTASGAIDANGGIAATTAIVEDLTAGRVVLAGTSGEIEDSGNLTFDGSTLAVTGAATVSTNLTISGNLTVNGTTTQINTVNTTIEDTLLELQKVDGGNLGSDTNKDVGLVMNYYSGSAKKAAFYWDDSAARFVLAGEASETTGVMSPSAYGGLEVGSLYVNDCAGQSQVISCSGTTRSLENITLDGGSF